MIMRDGYLMTVLGMTGRKKKPSITGMYENEVVPWKGYHDYESIVAAEDYYGVPMGEYHTFEVGREEHTSPASCPLPSLWIFQLRNGRWQEI